VKREYALSSFSDIISTPGLLSFRMIYAKTKSVVKVAEIRLGGKASLAYSDIMKLHIGQ
jgi:hypothetical protein